MLVFVVSDTHDRLDKVMKFVDILKSESRTGYVIHLGDVVSPFTLRALVENMPSTFKFKLILGNNDGDVLLLSKVFAELSEQPEEAELCGLRVLMLHGFKNRELTEKIVEGLACGGSYDIILYGHTHMYRLNKVCSSYIVNPGSLAGYLASTSTYARIDCRDLTLSIVDLETGNLLAAAQIEKQ